MRPHRPIARLAAPLAVAVPLAATLLAARAARAQVVETAVAFDSAQRVTVVTPPLAARLRLAPPTWPVSGDYREARLYASGDAFVIVVRRGEETVERYPLTAAQRQELAAAITTAMAVAGNPVGEERPEVISEPAKGAFIRNQMLAAALVYGPSLAALTHDPSTGAAVYLGVTGASYFVAAGLTKNRSVTRAQNDLATDGAIRGALITSGLVYGFTGDRGNDDAYYAAIFAGSLGGSLAGFWAGRGLTDGEVHGMTTGSTMAFATVGGIMGAAGAFRDRCGPVTVNSPGGPYQDWRCTNPNRRAETLGLAGAALLGYPLGLRYVRRAGYTVTAGDTRTLYVAGALGAMTALIPLVDADVSEEAAYGVATAGLVAGLLAGDRLLVRPYDHTPGEGLLLGVGAVAGGLLGAVPVVSTRSGTAALASVTAGAIIGTVAAEHIIAPRRAGALRVGSAGVTRGTSGAAAARRRVEVHVDPTGAAFAAARLQGNFPVLSLTF